MNGVVSSKLLFMGRQTKLCYEYRIWGSLCGCLRELCFIHGVIWNYPHLNKTDRWIVLLKSNNGVIRRRGWIKLHFDSPTSRGGFAYVKYSSRLLKVMNSQSLSLWPSSFVVAVGTTSHVEDWDLSETLLELWISHSQSVQLLKFWRLLCIVLNIRKPICIQGETASPNDWLTDWLVGFLWPAAAPW